MKAAALHISMQLANKVFACAQSHAQAQRLGQIVLQSGEATGFSCQPESSNDGTDCIPVYRHGAPLPEWNGEYIQVDNDTRGVMQLRGWQQQDGVRTSWPLIAGDDQ